MKILLKKTRTCTEEVEGLEKKGGLKKVDALGAQIIIQSNKWLS